MTFDTDSAATVYETEEQATAARNDNITKSATPTLEGTIAATDNGLIASVQVQLLSKDNSDLTGDVSYTGVIDGVDWSVQLPALADGKYSYKVILTDLAGNVSESDPLTFERDSTAPDAAKNDLGVSEDFLDHIDGEVNSGELTDNITNNPKPVFTGSAEANSSITIEIDGAGSYTTSADNSGQWKIDLGNEVGDGLLDGTYNYTVKVEDVAGNASVANAEVVIDTKGRRS